MAQKQIYGIILIGATILREAGQGRNPAALSECELCALFILKNGIRERSLV